MKPLSPDTPLEVERLWIAGLRDKGPVWRLRQMANMTSLCWRAARDAYHRVHPHASAREQDLWLLQERYGGEIAQRVVELRCQRGFYTNEP